LRMLLAADFGGMLMTILAGALSFCVGVVGCVTEPMPLAGSDEPPPPHAPSANVSATAAASVNGDLRVRNIGVGVLLNAVAAE